MTIMAMKRTVAVNIHGYIDWAEDATGGH